MIVVGAGFAVDLTPVKLRLRRVVDRRFGRLKLGSYAPQLVKRLEGFGLEIDLDANGNIFTGGIRSDESTLERLGIDVVKLSSNGTTVWNKYVATYTQGIPGKGSFDLAADSTGGVVVVGEFTGNVDFNPSPKRCNASTGAYSQWASYALNLSSAGNFKWVNTFVGTAGSAYNDAVAVDVDASGNVIVAGRFSASVDFKSGAGTAILTGGTAGASYVTKLNASGVFVWARAFGLGNTSADTSFVKSLAVDSMGTIYVAGYFKGTCSRSEPLTRS